MAAASEVIKAATIEKQFNDLISLYIYATFKDIKKNWNGSVRYSPEVYENYDHLLTAKGRTKLKAVFTISTEVKQMYTSLFDRFMVELKNIEIAEGDNLDNILIKICKANAEHYADFIFTLATQIKPYFGENLKEAFDPITFFRQKFDSFLPAHKNRPIQVAELANLFDIFLKATAWIIGVTIWHTGESVNCKNFVAMLATRGLDQDRIDMLQGILRQPKKSAKSKSAPSKSAPSKQAAPPAQVPAVVDTKPENIAAAVPLISEVEHDELDQLLNSV